MAGLVAIWEAMDHTPPRWEREDWLLVETDRFGITYYVTDHGRMVRYVPASFDRWQRLVRIK